MTERNTSPPSTPPPSYLPTAEDVSAASSSAGAAPPSTAFDVPEQKLALISTILSIPSAAISQVQSATSDKRLIGTGELRVYSSAPLGEATNVPATTFMTLETNDTPTKSYKSLITHPLMPNSTAQKTGDDTWQFSVVGNGFLELRLPQYDIL